MIISNDVFNAICILDDDICKGIAVALNSKLNNVLLTGFPLSDSFANGYSKATNLVVNLLLCNIDSKEEILKQINKVDLSYYKYNSCKSCFSEGFIHAINQFNLEMENYN